MKAMTKRRKLLSTLAVVAVVAGFGALGSLSAFTATTSNTGNQITSGTVIVGQHSGAATLYNVSNQKPGDATTKCIRIAYTGSLSAAVRLYVSSGITNGSLYNLKVERGSGLTTLDNTMSCAGFTPDGTNPIAYDGALGSFGSSWAGGIAAKNAGAAWATNDPKDYRFTITQNDDITANAHTTATSSGAHTFTWEARNLGTYSAKVLATSGLVSYWRLGEASGNPTADDSYGSNDGTYTNGPTLGQPGAITDPNTAVSFDGADDYVNMGDAASLEPGLSDYSFELWLKRSSSGIPASSLMLLSKGGGGNTYDYDVYIAGGTGKLTSRIGAPGVARSAGAITDANWHHVAVTIDRDGPGKVYIDGVLNDEGTDASPQAGVQAGAGTETFNLARRSLSTPLHFPGLIDDVAVYNRVLTAAEISEHYNAGT